MTLLQICKRRKLLIIAVLVLFFFGSVYYYVKIPKVFETTAEIVIIPPNSEILTVMTTYYMLKSDFNYKEIINKWAPGKQLNFLNSEDLISETISKQGFDRDINSVLKNIDIKKSNYPYHFYIKYKDTDKQRMTAFLNKLLENTKSRLFNNNKLFIFKIREFLEEKLVDIGNNLIEIQDDKRKISENIKSLARTTASLEINLKQKQCESSITGSYNDLLSGLVASNPSEGSNFKNMSSMEKELIKSTNNYWYLKAENSKKTDNKLYLARINMLEKQEQWVKEWELQNLKEFDIKLGANSLLDKIQNDLIKTYVNLEGQKRICDIQKTAIKTSIQKLKIPKGDKNFESEKNFEFLNYTYETINKKMPAIRSLRTDKMETLTIKEKASPPNKVIWPNYWLILLIFLLSSLPVSLILIIAIESFDKTIYKDKIRLFFPKIPELATIPWIKQNNERLLIYDPEIMEAHRTLRNNLKKIINDEGGKIFTILSGIEKDGKTSTLLGLAVNSALSGKKVLIIDANFYNPVLHIMLYVSNENGLTALFQNTTSLEDSIQLTSHQNLEIITSGKLFNGAPEYLNSVYFSDLLEYLKTKYDLIFIDTPALNISLDGFVVTKFADCIFLLVGLGKVLPRDIKILQYYASRLIHKSIGYIIKIHEK